MTLSFSWWHVPLFFPLRLTPDPLKFLKYSERRDTLFTPGTDHILAIFNSLLRNLNAAAVTADRAAADAGESTESLSSARWVSMSAEPLQEEDGLVRS